MKKRHTTEREYIYKQSAVVQLAVKAAINMAATPSNDVTTTMPN